MKKSILIVGMLLSILFLKIEAQTGIYKTYEDYVNGNLQEMDDYKSYFAVSKTTLYFVKDGQKVSYDCDSFWGFMVDGALFRNIIKYGLPVRLMSKDKLCYYENGFKQLQILKDQNTNSHDRPLSYFSQDLSSDIAFIPYPYSKSDAKEYIGFMNTHPEHKDLYDCMSKDYFVDNVKKCVNDYQPEGWIAE